MCTSTRIQGWVGELIMEDLRIKINLIIKQDLATFRDLEKIILEG